MPGIKIGVAEEVITPSLGVPLAGFGAREGVAEGMHDELHVRAIVVEGDDMSVAIASASVISLPQPVIDASFTGNFSAEVSTWLSGAGWGWHIETGTHVLRLILSGAFDRYPSLQIIIGHLGEALPFMLPRIDEILSTELTKLHRPTGAYLRENLHYTISGFNFLPPFRDLLNEVGVDRIMFSADYPFGSMTEAHTFLDQLPVSPADRERIAHGNAEALMGF